MEQSMTTNHDLWSAMLPNGDVRSGTLEQLKEAVRSGHLGGGTMVRAHLNNGNNWTPLSDVLPAAIASEVRATHLPSPAVSVPPQPGPSPSERDAVLWQVRLANGEVRSGTRQQLEDALRAGHVDEGTLVLTGAASEWTPLGALRNRVESSGAVVTSHSPRERAPAQERSAPDASLPTRSDDAPQESDAMPAQQGASRLDVGDEAAESSAVRQGSPQWQIQLTEDQLDEAFRVGLLGEDVLVLAIGTDQWVRFGDLQRPPSNGSGGVAPRVRQGTS